MAPRPSTGLDQVRARVRRAQLIIGLGFIAFVVGRIFSGNLIARLMPRLQAMNSQALLVAVYSFVLEFWILVVLPVLCYGVARVIPLKPVTTAVGAGLTGEFIAFMIEELTGGLESLWQARDFLFVRVVAGIGGVLITMWAVKSALTRNDAVEQEAKQASDAKKNEYEEFAKEAERLAAQREKPAEPTASDAPGPGNTGGSPPSA